MNSKAFVRFLLQAALASVAFSCSFIASTKNEQCRTDGDCAKFPGYTCDLGDHVCVRRLGAGGAGGDGAGGTDDPEGRDASTGTEDADTNDAPSGDATPWGCLGHVASEPVAKSNPTLTLVLRDATIPSKAVTSDTQATACSKLDTACASPSAGPLAPDPTGAVPLVVEAGFAGFVEILPTSASSAYPPFLFFVNPPVNNDRTSVVPLISSANFNILVVATGGGKQDPSLGSVIFLARDCLGSAAEDVSASIDGAPMPVEGGLATGTRFYLANGLPSLNVGSTDLQGIGGFINVVPGTHVVSAVRQSTGMAIAKISVLIRPGTISLASLSPLP